MEVIDRDGSVIATTTPSALTVTPHPLTLAGQKHIAYELVPGETLGAFLRRHVDNMGSGAWVVTIGGYEVPAALWEKTFPKHGTIIECRSVVQKQAVALIAVVALSMFAPYLAGAAYGALGGTFVAANAGLVVGAMTAAITVAGSLIINKVLGPKQPDPGDMRDSQASPTYSLAGGRNRSRQFEPIGMLFGELRVIPDFAGVPYSWYDGDDQWLYSVFHAGINVTAVSDIRVGQTPISSYTDVFTRATGITGMTSLPLEMWTDVDAIAGAALVGGTPGAWLTRTSSANALVLQADFEGSLYAVSSTGKITAQGTSIEGQYRLLPNGGWLDFIPAGTGFIESASTKPVRRTYTKNVPLGQYEVRFRKMDADFEATDRASKLTWTQLKTIQNDGGNYGGMGRLGVRIKASGQINGALDEINWLATAKPLTYWNGTSWVTATSRANGLSNPGAQILQFARGIYDSSNKLIAGLGLADSQIDFESLQGFMVWCASIGATFDYYMDSPTSCQDILDSIAAVGLGTITWQTGKLGVAWAADNQPIQGVVNMATMKAKTFSVSYQTLDTADSIEYAYYDRDKGYTWQTLRVTDPNQGTSLNPARISSIGVTTAAHAALLARFHLAQSIFQRKDITYDTDLEHLTYKRMSVLALTHDVTQWGYGGRLDAVTNNGGFLTLTLDDVVPAGSGARYIGLRVPGEVGYRVFGVNAFSGSSRTITLSTAWPGSVPVPGATSGNPACDTIWIYDFKSTPGYKVRVTGIQPQSGMMGATVTVVPEGPEFWTYVTNGTYVPLTSQSLLGRGLPNIGQVKVTEELQREGSAFYVDLTATFSTDGQYDHAQVWASINGGPMVNLGSTPTQRFTWRANVDDHFYVEVRPFDSLGRLGVTSGINYTVVGPVLPQSVANFTVTVRADGTRDFRWTTSNQPIDVTTGGGFRIRYRSSTLNTAWVDMTPLHNGLLTESPLQIADPVAGNYDFAIVAVNSSLDESTPAFINDAAIGREPVSYGATANMLLNSDWQLSNGLANGITCLYGWTWQPGTLGAPVDVGRHSSLGFNPGRGGAYIADTTQNPGSYQYHYIEQIVDGIIAGQTYELSVLCAPHRCAVAMDVAWLNSSNALITSTVSQSFDAYAGFVDSRPGIGAMVQLWDKAVAPAGAVKATFRLFKYATSAGQTSSFGFFNRAMFCLAPAGASRAAPSPWIEAGQDQLHGGSLAGLSVNSAQIANEAATTVRKNTVGDTNNWALNNPRVCEIGFTADANCTLLITVTINYVFDYIEPVSWSQLQFQSDPIVWTRLSGDPLDGNYQNTDGEDGQRRLDPNTNGAYRPGNITFTRPFDMVKGQYVRINVGGGGSGFHSVWSQIRLEAIKK